MNQERIEQYKLYVQMADQISERRQKVNQFYISIQAILLSVPSVLGSKNLLYPNLLLLAITLLGTLLCILWLSSIRSYQLLNWAKYKVILLLEQDLSFACYGKEQAFLQTGNVSSSYFTLTSIERLLPLTLLSLYLGFVLYLSFQFFTT